MSTEHETDGPKLPPRPRQPEAEDCCGSGCDPCIFDLYEDALQRWEAQVERIRQEWHEQRQQTGG